jgi:hypothetical protein
MSLRDSRTAGLRRAESEVLGYPDAVFLNGRFLTVDADFSIAQAVAIRGGRFLAVGTTEEIHSIAGPHTDVVDLRGATVLPGLIDTHAHVERAGLVKFTVQLNDVRSVESGFRTNFGTCSTHPKGKLDPRRTMASGFSAGGKALSDARGIGPGRPSSSRLPADRSFHAGKFRSPSARRHYQ